MEKKNLDRSFTHLPKFDLNSSVSSALPFKPFLNGQTHKAPRRTWHVPTKQIELDTFKLLSLPNHVVKVYSETRKIKTLYDWQKNCLEDVRLLKGGNFILSLPTGAGKTLVAELLMLRCTSYRQKSCILVLPFIAIATEKVVSLSVFEESLDICIEEFAGQRGKVPPLRRPNNSVYVCTIEKANILINSMISEGRMNEIGLVIVDELHMISDPQRGFILEQCLTKLILTNSSAQIIGLSATLSSIEKLKKFLNANLYQTDFRPVNLVENIKFQDDIFRYNKSKKCYEFSHKLKRIVPKQKDPDNIIPLIDEIIPQKSVMIFCPTKQACESLTQNLAQLMPKKNRDFQKELKEKVIQQIIDSNDGVICPTMKAGILAGVCYHHSGLTRDERILVESSFKDGVISIICATSTLATGVNLPARRIIIRSTRIGLGKLDKVQYLQMIGRSGRAGLDTEGDSFICIEDAPSFYAMREKELSPIVSQMNNVACIETFILDLLSLNICKNEADIQNALKKTMFDSSESHMEIVKQATDSLIQKKLLKNENLEITELGMATSKSNLSPEHAVKLYKDLMVALDQGLVLSSRFHLLCIITPYDVDLNSINFSLFHEEYENLTKGEKELLNKSGVTLEKIINSMSISTKLKTGDAFQRTYIAFMLKHLWSNMSLSAVAERFSVSRGWLNSTMQNVIMYSNQISRFCAEISKFFAYRQLFPDLIHHLKITNQKELSQLMELDCIKLSRAQCLYNAGIKTIGEVAKSTPEELIKCIHLLNNAQANRIIASAKILFRDMLAEKAQELMLIGANTQDIQQKCRPNLDTSHYVDENATPERKRRRSSSQ